LDGLSKLKTRAARAGSAGNREYNPGWHTALDLPNLLTVSEAITRSALERRESRGAQFRDDYPDKSDEYSKFNIVLKKSPDGQMQVMRQPLPELRPDLKQVIEENK
jgi:succinate dehydrogenase / fumarate reductase, flavoprotein subunit